MVNLQVASTIQNFILHFFLTPYFIFQKAKKGRKNLQVNFHEIAITKTLYID